MEVNYMAFTDSQMFAAIIGGVIGIIPTFTVTYFYEFYKKKRDDSDKYRAWMNGLLAELTHISGCIAEIKGFASKNQVPTKRLNSDFIEKARMVLIDYNTDKSFFIILTNCYRDIVHTNDMLNRLENNPALGFFANVIDSLNGVSGSIINLEKELNNTMAKKNK
jgi:hypothetical protein